MAIRIRLSKSTITKKDKKAVQKVLGREFLGMGEEVFEFENHLTDFFGRPVVCVVNATAALHLSLQELRFKKGTEVLVQSLTYISTYQAIKAAGYTPISCDVNKIDYTIDLKDAKKKLTKKTRIIIPVHYSGGVGAIDKLYKFAKKHNLRVVEDAAHAFGTKFMNKRIGSFGDISCFSFDGIKNITSGEGGCVVSSDDSFLDRIKNARLLGVINDSEKRFNNRRSLIYKLQGQGWRYHMSNIMAAIGNEQLKRFNKISLKRQKLAMQYDKLLKNITSIKFIQHNYSNVVPHIYVARIFGLKNKLDLIKKMSKKNIEIGFHYTPNHLYNFFSNRKKNNLSNTELVYPELISLPLHLDLKYVDQKYIIKSLISILNI